MSKMERFPSDRKLGSGLFASLPEGRPPLYHREQRPPAFCGWLERQRFRRIPKAEPEPEPVAGESGAL